MELASNLRFFSSCSDFGIFRHRDLVLNPLMRALGVVVFNVVLDAFTQFLDIIRGIDIYILALWLIVVSALADA